MKLRFRLRVWCWYRETPSLVDKTEPLMDAYFDSYGSLLAWLNAHMGLNFHYKDYFIKIESEEIL